VSAIDPFAVAAKCESRSAETLVSVPFAATPGGYCSSAASGDQLLVGVAALVGVVELVPVVVGVPVSTVLELVPVGLLVGAVPPLHPARTTRRVARTASAVRRVEGLTGGNDDVKPENRGAGRRPSPRPSSRPPKRHLQQADRRTRRV
jgi:hypothetical protein